MTPLFGLFLFSGFVLAVTPGPAVLYLVARSIDQGWRAGVVSCLGVFSACLVHVAAAALGLSALLASSALLFDAVRWAGAAYLVWLGISALRRPAPSPGDRPSPAPLGQVWRDGFVVNLLNPKTTLFFLAFLPQFVDPSLGQVTLQVLVLGLSFAGIALTTDLAWALTAGTLGEKIRSHQAFLKGQKWVTGSVYLGLGLLAAFGVKKT